MTTTSSPGCSSRADRLGEQQVERGHVGAEADLVGVAAEEVGRRRVGAVDDGIGLFAGGEEAVDVGVVVDEVAGDRVDDAWGICVPPGPSKYAAGRPSIVRSRAGNWLRT